MNNYQPKNILVTGGAGFIGCNYVRYMFANNDDINIVNSLLRNADLPLVDEEVYRAARERAQQAEVARTDYYDGPDDNVVGNKDKTSSQDDKEVGDNAAHEELCGRCIGNIEGDGEVRYFV
mgnify:CR=1 FL=1